MFVTENTPIKARVGVNEFDLTPIQEAIEQSWRLINSIDTGNAAKNCADTVRSSPLGDLLEQADALLVEMRASMVVIMAGQPVGAGENASGQ